MASKSIVAALLLAISAQAGRSQTCVLLPSQAKGGIRVEFDRSAHRYATGGGISLSTSRNFFVTPRIGWLRDSEQASTLIETSLQAGIALGTLARICPIAAVDVGAAVLDPFNRDRRNYIVDSRIGVATGQSTAHGNLEFRGSLSIELARVSVTPYSPWPSGDLYKLFSLGVGAGWADRLYLRMLISVPVGLTKPGFPNRDLVVPFGREERELGVRIGLGMRLGR